MGTSEDLEILRSRIDEVDKRILDLLNDRGRFAIEISKLKRMNSYNVYDPAREREIKRNLSRRNQGPLSHESIISIFRDIISACRSLQNTIKVSFLGPEGSYSHQAAFHEFGSSAELIPQGSFEEVVEEVERDRCTFGIVPIENSIEGSIGGVLDVLSKSDLKIISEYYERISHCLLSKSGEMNEIEIIASHPQALGQCKGWIGNHLKRAEIRETSSTAKAAMLASRNRRFAAVVGELASTIYKLRVVATKIEDSAQNTTRFWVIGKTNSPLTGDDKTSIVFSLKDEPGALQRSFFLPFSEAKINLTKIESRPSKERPWEYIFFIDFLGHIIDKKVQRVLSKVRRRCINLKVLGSYPRGESDK